MDTNAAKRLIAKYRLWPDKAKGQNFLVSDSAVNCIVNSAAQKAGDILEIGAGLGTLTFALCTAARKVVTIEIDKTLKPLLESELGSVKNSVVVYDDFLAADIESIVARCGLKTPLTVVSNLPYSITAKILYKLFYHHHMCEKAVLMMQSEVADKLKSPPGQKSYRPISVLSQSLCSISQLLTLSPADFYPQPTVNSTVLCLEFSMLMPAYNLDINSFAAFLKVMFNNRRKTLLSALKGSPYFDKAKSLSIDKNLRVETLNAEELVSLYKKLI